MGRVEFYYLFALFKIAVIRRQIYHRYRQGFSNDPRFAAMNDAVRVFAARAACELEKHNHDPQELSAYRWMMITVFPLH